MTNPYKALFGDNNFIDSNKTENNTENNTENENGQSLIIDHKQILIEKLQFCSEKTIIQLIKIIDILNDTN